MIATIVPDVRSHYPVLLSELISIITPQYGGTFIDCTFGQGGYSKKILNFAETKVIALDRDLESQKNLENSIENYQNLLKLNNIIEKKFQKDVKNINEKTKENILKITSKKNAAQIK